MSERHESWIRAVLVDFGGVLAEEGFREGLKAIARTNNLEPESFFRVASELAYDSGYVVGSSDESHYWSLLRQATGIAGSDEEFRTNLLNRFIIREWILDVVRKIRDQVSHVCVLSDQTNWLDELNDKYDFFKEFSQVFNSYHLGKGKKDPTLFTDIVKRLGIAPREALFIDDSKGHIERARSVGLNAILFVDRDSLVLELQKHGLTVR